MKTIDIEREAVLTEIIAERDRIIIDMNVRISQLTQANAELRTKINDTESNQG